MDYSFVLFLSCSIQNSKSFIAFFQWVYACTSSEMHLSGNNSSMQFYRHTLIVQPNQMMFSMFFLIKNGRNIDNLKCIWWWMNERYSTFDTLLWFLSSISLKLCATGEWVTATPCVWCFFLLFLNGFSCWKLISRLVHNKSYDRGLTQSMLRIHLNSIRAQQ